MDMKAVIYAALIALVPTFALSQGESGSDSMNRIQGSGDSGSGTTGSEESAKPQGGLGTGGANNPATNGSEASGAGRSSGGNPTAPRQQP